MAQVQHCGEKQAGGGQQGKGVPQAGLRLLFLPPAAAQGNLHRAAHAQAGAGRLNERGDGVGDIDGGQAQVAHIPAYKKAVHNGVQPREGERQHGGQHKPEKFLFHGNTSKG